MEMVEVTKCENGYLIKLESSVHVVSGFESHAALGKVVAEALGVAEVKKERKPRTKKEAISE